MFITGIGLFTPLGETVASTYRALLGGKYSTTHARGRPLNEMAVAAAREALSDAGWDPEAATALVVGTSRM